MSGYTTEGSKDHCPTMVSSFKLSSGAICLLRFCCRAGHIRREKFKKPCSGSELGFGVRDAQCHHRWYSLVPSVL